jgi:hypothetical protein
LESGFSRKREFVVRRFLIASSNSTRMIVIDLLPENDCRIYGTTERRVHPVPAAPASKEGHAEKEPRHPSLNPSPSRAIDECEGSGRQKTPHHEKIEHVMHEAEPRAVDDSSLHQQPENEIDEKYRIGDREEIQGVKVGNSGELVVNR